MFPIEKTAFHFQSGLTNALSYKPKYLSIFKTAQIEGGLPEKNMIYIRSSPFPSLLYKFPGFLKVCWKN